MRGLVPLVVLLLPGCFTELTGTRCSVAAQDCFKGELCVGGDCVAVVGEGSDAAADSGGDRVSLVVTVVSPEPLQSPAHVRADGDSRCDCTSQGQPCVLSVPADTPTWVCAWQNPFRACRTRVETPTEGQEVTVRLLECADDGCAGHPPACGCPDGMPECPPP